MLKLTNTASTTLTANQVIPMSVAKNTNTRLSFSDNNVVVNSSGLLKIDAMFTINVTTAGAISVQLYNGTTAIPGAIATQTASANAEAVTINLTDIELIYPAVSDKAKLNFVVSGAGTMTNALATFVYEQ